MCPFVALYPTLAEQSGCSDVHKGMLITLDKACACLVALGGSSASCLINQCVKSVPCLVASTRTSLVLRPPPPPSPCPPSPLLLQDLGQVSGEELVGYLHEQGGYCLRKGLKDMGVSLDSMRSYGEWAGQGCWVHLAVSAQHTLTQQGAGYGLRLGRAELQGPIFPNYFQLVKC